MLDRRTKTPFTTLLTASVIGIAIAFPIALHLLVANMEQLSGHWDQSGQISLYLNNDSPPQQAQRLATRLRQHEQIVSVDIITPEQALDEFGEFTGFGDLASKFETNPLPFVLLINPVELPEPHQIEALLDELGSEPHVAFAELDLMWVKRLQALSQLMQQATQVLGVVLGIGVFLVIGNTVRLELQEHRDAIEVYKLIGATDSYIQRPYMYDGIAYGLLGAAVALAIIEISLSQILPHIHHLLTLYPSQISGVELDLPLVLKVLLISGFLGLISATFYVRRYLRAVEPN